MAAELSRDFTVAQTAAILYRYGFELRRGDTAQNLISQWIARYSSNWVRLAVVEALYQGRYKAISVEHILNLWLRRGQPTFHFTHEFERLISHNLIPSLDSPGTILRASKASIASPSTADKHRGSIDDLQERQSPIEVLANFEIPDLSTSLESQAKESDSRLMDSSVSIEKIHFSEPDSHRKIHEFTPLPDRSEFYSKLRSVMHQGLEEEL